MTLPVPAVTPEQSARFASDIGRIWPQIAADEAKLGLAVSGGPDSLALLLLAHAVFPGKFAAATVDHGLRADSAGEAAEVARICALLAVPHHILTVKVAEGNLQSEARSARYAAMAEWLPQQAAEGAPLALATAHHADDQAETLLMRLNRASGVAGLAGVRERSQLAGQNPTTPIALLRPVLGWRRTDLAMVVAASGLVAADDPSNHNEAFDRVRLRAQLANNDWLDVAAIANSATHLADADVALDWAAAREWDERVVSLGLGMNYRPQAPRAIALRVVARIIAKLGGAQPRGSAVARLFDALLVGQVSSIGDLVARPGPSGWSFSKAPKRRS